MTPGAYAAPTITAVLHVFCRRPASYLCICCICLWVSWMQRRGCRAMLLQMQITGTSCVRGCSDYVTTMGPLGFDRSLSWRLPVMSGAVLLNGCVGFVVQINSRTVPSGNAGFLALAR